MIRRRVRKRLQNRRGVTLILMTVMLVVLLGAAAFAIDFGRMYLFRAQLHAATDAAVLSAAVRVLADDEAGAADTAVAYAARHGVENVAVTLNLADITPGTWTTGGGFVPVADWTVPGITAVRATTRYNANYGFGRIFGLTSHTVTVTSEAAIGYVGATSCIRPTALPYQKLLDQIYPPAGTKDAQTYSLTANDVDRLRAATMADSIQLRVTDVGSTVETGNFYGVQLGPIVYADGTPGSPVTTGVGNYATDFGAACGSATYRGGIGPGDWLAPQNGAAAGPVESGFEILCGVTIRGVGHDPCPTPQSIKVAIWAPPPAGMSIPASCTSICFYVKYTGVFVVTAYTKNPGGPGVYDGIWGYFSAMPTSGTFTSTPGPLEKIALVR
jgi:Flp pilus assembly protein TadG